VTKYIQLGKNHRIILLTSVITDHRVDLNKYISGIFIALIDVNISKMSIIKLNCKING